MICNTSLKMKGRGFIKWSSELFGFAAVQGIDVVVIEERMFLAFFIKATLVAGEAPQNVSREGIPAGTSALNTVPG